MDTHSPTTVAQLTPDSPLLSPIQGWPQLMPPRVGQPGAADVSMAGTATASDATPTPREAARRLARFTEEVQLKWTPPLIASPPTQKAPATKTMPIRSERIAAQPLAHIPASKQGEVLLMQKMGIAPPTTLVSFASKRSYDAIFTGNLTLSHMAALDELFLATNVQTSRRTLFSDGGVGSRNQRRRSPAP